MPQNRFTKLVIGALLLLLASCSQVQDPAAQLPGEIEPANHVSGVDLHTGNTRTVNGAIWNYPVPFNVGTGQINPFLSIQANGTEAGFNTDTNPLPLDTKRPEFTNALPLNHVPVILVSSDLYREFILDANEANSGVDAQFNIQLFDLWLCDDADAPDFDDVDDFEGNDDCALVYEKGADVLRATDAVTSGSGLDLDYQILIPNANFAAALAAMGASPNACPYMGIDAAPCGMYLVLNTVMGATPANASDPESNWITGATFEELSTIKRPFATVMKTAETDFTRVWEWDIDKTVTPDTWDLFTGESGTSDYEVTVTKTGSHVEDLTVSGTVTVTNPSDEDVTVLEVTDEMTDGVTTVTVTLTCPAFPVTLEPDESLECTYSEDVSGLSLEPEDLDNWTNTAFVELQDLAITSVTVPVTVGDPTTVVNDTVNVTDTVQGDLGSASDTKTFEYSATFTCDDDEGTHDNTATIVETEQTASASVEVSCYDLEVTKDANTAATKTFVWDIEKTSDTTELELQATETFDVEYEVTVSVIDTILSDFAVSGDITVTNNHPSRDADLTDVVDVVDGVSADVNCPSLTVPAGGSLVCSYSADLPDDDTVTNTATATQQLYDFDSDEIPTADGTQDYSGDATVDFSGATLTLVDECIDVSDTLAGAQGEVCADSDTFTETITYEYTVGPFGECGEFIVENVASFETTDTGATGDDDHVINVTIDCPEGCTLTQGYWKTHNLSFPGGASKKADATWDEIGPLAEDELFFISGKTWFEVFWTPPGGNVYYNLAHQYMAAVLNGLAGADTSAVDDELAAAAALLSANTPAQAQTLKGNAARPWRDLASVLDDYNNGLIGPGHCDEDPLPI